MASLCQNGQNSQNTLALPVSRSGGIVASMLRLAIAVGSVLLTIAVLAAFSAAIEGPIRAGSDWFIGQYGGGTALAVTVGGIAVLWLLSARANRRDLQRQLV